MIVVGLMLIPLALLIMMLLNKFKLNKSIFVVLNVLLLMSAFLYVVLSLTLKTEPFNFDITSVGDYFIYSAVVFVFSPFLWIVLYYYCKKIFINIRIRKNAKIKNEKDYMYYRDDLNKISPTLVMFTSLMDTDVKKSIAATILKLKLTGYVKEIDNKLQCTNKKCDNLLETEKMVLNSIKNNILDEKTYRKTIEKEAVNLKYIRKNNGGKALRIIKMLTTVCIPIILIICSIRFDEYVFKNYEIYVLDDIRYLKIDNEEEIENLYYNEIKNKDDYYHTYWEEEDYWSYNYSLIRADKFEYSVVRKKIILDILDLLFVLTSIISIFVAIFKLIEQIIYFNKNYTRTIKGNELLNKAYALKNYLKDYSLIKNRTEEEIVLWEDYLIYAIILDVNVKVKDEIIEKYSNNIILQ